MSNRLFLFLCIYPIFLCVCCMYLLSDAEEFAVYLKGIAVFVVGAAPLVIAALLQKPYQPPVD